MSADDIRDKLWVDIEETAMEMFDNPGGDSRLAIRQAIKELRQGMEEEEEPAAEEAVDEEADDEERAMLMKKLVRLRLDPDVYAISDTVDENAGN